MLYNPVNLFLLQTSLERFSPSSEEFSKDLKDDDTSSTVSESTIREQVELFEMISRINKRLLKEEECLVRLQANLKKCDKVKTDTEVISKRLNNLRTEMAKSACEMQHNNIVLEETQETLSQRRMYLENLHKDLITEDKEYEMLQALLYSHQQTPVANNRHHNYHQPQYTKELLDTLV